MSSSLDLEDRDMANRLQAAVDGARPSPYLWPRIEARISSPRLLGIDLWWLTGRSVPAYTAALVIMFGVAFGVWNWVIDDSGNSNVLRTATLDSETVPLVEVGDKLVASGEPITGGVHETNPAPFAQQGDLDAQRAIDPLIQIPLEFQTDRQVELGNVLERLAATEFRVTSLQVGRGREQTMIFDSNIRDYWREPNLPVRQITGESDCVTTPVDIPEAGSMTVCQLRATRDGVKVGESFDMPVYRVTEATYSPSGEATVRVDERTATPAPYRSTVYHGEVEQWRLTSNGLEHRNVISDGDFNLVGDPRWRSSNLELESAAEIIEWLIAMQMPKRSNTPYPGHTFEELFVPGATFDGQSFFSVTEVADSDDSIAVYEARRTPGFYGSRYDLERRNIGSGEMLRFEIDTETGLPERLLFTSDSNLPYSLQFSFVMPIVFEFDYPEG